MSQQVTQPVSNPQSGPPAPLIATSMALGFLLFGAAIAGLVARFAISIRDDCFFTNGNSNFEAFRRSGRVCDASFGVNFVIGTLLSLESQIDLVVGIGPIMKSRLIVFGCIGTVACWTVARIATLATLAALGLPFEYYVIPPIIALGAGVPQIALLAISLKFIPQEEQYAPEQGNWPPSPEMEPRTLPTPEVVAPLRQDDIPLEAVDGAVS